MGVAVTKAVVMVVYVYVHPLEVIGPGRCSQKAEKCGVRCRILENMMSFNSIAPCDWNSSTKVEFRFANPTNYGYGLSPPVSETRVQRLQG